MYLWNEAKERNQNEKHKSINTMYICVPLKMTCFQT